MTDNGSTFQPATRSTWKRAEEETVPFMLPSGNPVLLRNPSLQRLIAQVASLTPLTGIAQRILDAVQGGASEMEIVAQVFGATPDLYQLTGPLCRAVFVAPRVVDTPVADDEISLDDLDEADRMGVLLHFFGVVDTLQALFRNARSGAPAGQPEPALRPNAE